MRQAILTRLRKIAASITPLSSPTEERCPAHSPAHSSFISDDLAPHISGLYQLWLAELLVYSDNLTARKGRLWLHRQVRLGLRIDVSASVIDFLLREFKLKACQQGFLSLNPKYTGYAPHPQYLINGGV